MTQETYSFLCTARRCGHRFLTQNAGDAYQSAFDHPECPKCGDGGCRIITQNRPYGVEPGAPNILSAKTKGSDQALKSLASRYNLSDMGQRSGTQTGESSMQLQQRALKDGGSVCSGIKGNMTHRVQMPAGFAKFKNSAKALPTHVVARHEG